MNSKNDAFGVQLLAEYRLNKGKDTVELIERDDGYIDTGSLPGSYFANYKRWKPTQKQAIKLSRGRVLDIGAGAGRHSLYLQRRGFDVTSIDSSPGAIKVCELRGIKKVKLMPIEGIGTVRTNSFDTILMFGNNFGLFSNPRKAKTLLRNMYRITSRNAQIIAETRNPYKTNDPNHLEYQRLNRKQGRMPGQIRIRVRFEKMISPWFDYLFVSPREMKEILKGTGWHVRRFISSADPDYIAVITKEK